MKRASLLVQFVDLPGPLDEPLLHSEKSVREEFRRISEKKITSAFRLLSLPFILCYSALKNLYLLNTRKLQG